MLLGCSGPVWTVVQADRVSPTPKGVVTLHRISCISGFKPTGKVSNTMKLEIGERVSHDTFGLGTVVLVSGDGDRAEATIDFGSFGEKRLLLRYAPVEKL